MGIRQALTQAQFPDGSPAPVDLLDGSTTRVGSAAHRLVGWGLVFAQMKQVFVMLHSPAAEARRVEVAARGKDPVSLGVDPDTAAPFMPYRGGFARTCSPE
jgi:hypothetical protein